MSCEILLDGRMSENELRQAFAAAKNCDHAYLGVVLVSESQGELTSFREYVVAAANNQELLDAVARRRDAAPKRDAVGQTVFTTVSLSRVFDTAGDFDGQMAPKSAAASPAPKTPESPSRR